MFSPALSGNMNGCSPSCTLISLDILNNIAYCCTGIGFNGKRRYSDNLFIERLWRTVKYEEVYLKAYQDGRDARAGIGDYFRFYNAERPHQALGYMTPAEVFASIPVEATPGGMVESLISPPARAFGPPLATPPTAILGILPYLQG